MKHSEKAYICEETQLYPLSEFVILQHRVRRRSDSIMPNIHFYCSFISLVIFQSLVQLSSQAVKGIYSARLKTIAPTGTCTA